MMLLTRAYFCKSTTAATELAEETHSATHRRLALDLVLAKQGDNSESPKYRELLERLSLVKLHVNSKHKRFDRTSLHEFDFNEGNLSQCDFSKAFVLSDKNVNFDGCTLNNVDLTNVDCLGRASFNGASMADSKVNIKPPFEFDFKDAILAGAELSFSPPEGAWALNEFKSLLKSISSIHESFDDIKLSMFSQVENYLNKASPTSLNGTLDSFYEAFQKHIIKHLPLNEQDRSCGDYGKLLDRVQALRLG
ncbi:pentapeptide repeat-containing protein [Serratia quinivorans]|uniref:pentapeptide repeat-containing protein n=1 Tax=Serratia quinivorans TaxID=137545 RepID=UPI0021BCFF69|nr:pentapeptide repeat-containing protein [Serratia quinivorans]